MRILDANDNEIQQADVDPELGYLKPDKIFVKHHDKVKEVLEKFHYKVLKFYFEDNTSMEILKENDPHVEVIDDQQGVFGYINLVGEPQKEFRGADIDKVVDIEAVEAAEAYDEYEDISRYILFTQEELDQKAAQREKAEKRTAFMETGPDRLDSTEVTLDDLTILVADIVAA